jgi:hypothetical protein
MLKNHSHFKIVIHTVKNINLKTLFCSNLLFTRLISSLYGFNLNSFNMPACHFLILDHSLHQFYD